MGREGEREEWRRERGRRERLPFTARGQRCVAGQTILPRAAPAREPLREQTMLTQRRAKNKKEKEEEETLRRRANPLIPTAAGLRGALRGRCTASHASKRLHSHSFCNDKMLTPSEGEKTEREQLPGKLSYVWEKLILLMKPGCTDSGAVYPPGQMKLIRVWRGE